MSLPISKNELYCCLTITVLHAFFGLYTLYNVSNWYVYKSNRSSLELSPYNYWIGEWRYDVKDTEWAVTRYDIVPALKCYLIHTILWRIFHRLLNPTLGNNIYAPISAIIIYIYLKNPFIYFLVIVLAVITISLSYLIRNEIIAWIICCAFLFDPKIQRYINIFEQNYLYRQYNFYTYTLIKILNVSIYFSRNKDVKISVKLLLRIILYLFYLPYASILIILFDDFNYQLDNLEKDKQLEITKINFKKIVFGGSRLVAWFVINEIYLHLFTVNELQYMDFDLLKQYNTLVLFIIGIFSCGFFYLKYLFIFGFPSYFAKIDQMMPPRKPVCVFTIARYGNIWRNFDRGLYQFMLRQIYIPFLQIEGRSLYLKYTFSLLMPFAFVLLWHGTSNKHLIWVSCSIIELAIEKIGYSFGKTQMWMNIKKYIGLGNAYRLKAAFCLLTVIPGLFGVISFILPPQNGGYICYKILFDGIIGIISGEWMKNIASPGFCLLYLMLFCYFYSHSCLYFEEKENVKRKKKIE